MFLLADRVKQTSLTSGTGDVILNDTFGGFQSFENAIGDNNSTYYTIENGTQFEIGIGTYSKINNSLSRDFIFVSSNSNNKIILDGGISIVFCTYPADRAFLLNFDGYATGLTSDYLGIKFPDGTIQTTAGINYIQNRTRYSRTLSINTTLNLDDDLIFLDSSSQELEITMPKSSDVNGYTLTFKKITGDNECVILPQSGDYIDSKASLIIYHNNVSLSLFSSGINWHII
jgi:hypothetical protein